jgi:hypothetical protein
LSDRLKFLAASGVQLLLHCRASMRGAKTPRFDWTQIGFVLSVLASSVALCFRPLTDYDLPWNLATGRIIWNTQSIPRIDDLAFTARPLRYVEPLGDLLLFLTEHLLGVRGLQVLGALLAGVVVLTLFAFNRRAGPMAVLITGFAGAALASWLYLRPVVFSFFGLGLTLGLLAVHRASPGTRRGRRALAWLIPFHWAWANTHGFVAIGCALVVGYAGVRLATRLLRGRMPSLFPRRDASDLGWTWSTCALVLVASSISPGGPRLLLGSMRFGEVNTGITEWARPNVGYLLYDQPVATAFIALAVLAWLCGRNSKTGRRLPDAFSIAVVASALFVYSQAVRMTPTAIVLLAAIVPPRLSQWVRPNSAAAIACAAAPFAALAWVALTIPMSARAGFDPARLPVGAATYVQQANLVGNPYNFGPFGGYLAWRLHPQRRVFMDGRNTLAREGALVERALRAGHDGQVFSGLVREFTMAWALTSAEEGTRHDLPLAASAEWRLVYLDDVAAVYVKRDGPNGHLAPLGYRRLRHLVSPHRLVELALRGKAPEDLAHDGALARQQAPSSARAAFLDACGALASRNADRFADARQHLAMLAPFHPALSVLSRAWEQAAR